MNNIEKYNKVFMSVFNVKKERLVYSFSINSVDDWDSITQLSLVTELENEFGIMLDSEEILEFRSYEAGKLILGKYKIYFEEQITL